MQNDVDKICSRNVLWTKTRDFLLAWLQVHNASVSLVTITKRTTVGITPSHTWWKWKNNNSYLLRRPTNALFQPLCGEPDFDLLLWMFGHCSEPGELSLCWVGKLVEGWDEGQVVIQWRVVFGCIEGHCDLRHLKIQSYAVIVFRKKHI